MSLTTPFFRQMRPQANHQILQRVYGLGALRPVQECFRLAIVSHLADQHSLLQREFARLVESEHNNLKCVSAGKGVGACSTREEDTCGVCKASVDGSEPWMVLVTIDELAQLAYILTLHREMLGL
jgi:hypothetical protein